VHDLLGEHLLAVELADELDVSQRTPARVELGLRLARLGEALGAGLGSGGLGGELGLVDGDELGGGAVGGSRGRSGSGSRSGFGELALFLFGGSGRGLLLLLLVLLFLLIFPLLLILSLAVRSSAFFLLRRGLLDVGLGLLNLLLVVVGGLFPGGPVGGGLLLSRLDRGNRPRALLELDLALADQQPAEGDRRLRREDLVRGSGSAQLALRRGVGREFGQGRVEVEAQRGVDLAKGDVAERLVEDEVDEAAEGLRGVDPDGEDLVADGLVLVRGDLRG